MISTGRLQPWLAILFSKEKLALAVIVLLLIFVLSAATLIANLRQLQSPLQITPSGLLTQDQAIAISIRVAQSWHEPNA